MLFSRGLRQLALLATVAVTLQGCRASLQWTGFGSDVDISTYPKLSLSLLSAPSQPAGSCFDLALTSQDVLGVTTSVSSDTTINLSYDQTGSSFYIGTGCGGGVVSTATLLAGQSTMTISYYGTVATAHQLVASAPGFQPSNLALTVTAGPAYSGSISANPTGVIDTSGATPSVITVTVYDQWSNLVPSQSVTFGAVTGVAGSLSSSSAVSSSVAGATYGQATVHLTPSGGLDGTRTVTVSAPAALAGLSTNVVFSSSPTFSQILATPSMTTNTAGTCVTFSIEARDQFNAAINVPANELITLSSSTAGTFYTSAGCAGPTSTVTISSGSSTATVYFRPTVAGAETVTFDPATAGTVTSNLTTVAGAIDPTNSTLVKTSVPSTYEADGAAQTTMTVTLLDAYLNPISGQNVTLYTTQAAVAGDAFAYPSGSVSNASGQVSATYVATQSGPRTFRISVPAVLDSAADSVSVDFIALTSLSLVQMPGAWSLPLGAGNCYALRIIARDNLSNPYVASGAGITIPLSSAASPAQTNQASTTGFYSNAGCSTPLSTSALITAGSSQVDIYFMPSKSGTVSLAMTSGVASGTMSSMAVNPSSPSVVTSTFTVDSLADVFADDIQTHTYTLTLRDAYQNAIPGSAVAAEVTPGMGDDASDVFAGFPITDSSGVSVGTLRTRRGTAKEVRVAAPAGMTSLTVWGNYVPVLETIQLSKAPAGNWKVGRCDQVTVNVRDIQASPFNHPFSQNLTVSYTAAFTQDGTNSGLFATAGCTGSGQSTLSLTLPANNSTVSFYFSARRAESLSFSVTGNVGAGLKVGSLGATATDPGDPYQGTLSALPATTLPADNTSVFTFSYTIQDIFGNALSGITPALTKTVGPTGFTLSGLTATDGSGSGTGTVRTPNGGAYTFRLDTTPALASPPTSTVTFTAPAYFASMDLSPATASPNAGACVAMTVVAKDQTSTNFVATTDETIFLNSSGSGLFFQDGGCSTGITQLTLSTGLSSRTFYFKPTSTAGETVTVTHASATADTAVFTPTPGAPHPSTTTLSRTTGPTNYEADGVTTLGFKVTLRDQFSNPVPGQTVAVYVSTGSNAGDSFNFPMGNVTNASGEADGTFSATIAGYREFRIQTPVAVDSPSITFFATFVKLDHFALQSIVAGAPATWGTTITAGGCYGLRVNAQDPLNNPYTAGAGGITIPLSGSVVPSQPYQTSTTAFYSDSVCTTPITNATIGSGTTSTDIFFRPTQVAASAMITLTAGTASGVYGTQPIENSGMPSLTYSSFTISPDGSPAWANQVDQFTMTLTMKDTYNNILPSYAATLTTATGWDTSETVSGYAGVTDASGVLTSTIRTSKNVIKTIGISSPAALSGMPTVVADFDPVLEYIDLVKTNPANYQVGRCDTVTVDLRDHFGDLLNSSSSLTLVADHLSSDQSGVGSGFFLAPGCSGSGTNTLNLPISSGTWTTTFYFAPKTTGTLELRVAGQLGPNLRISTLGSLPVNPGSAGEILRFFNGGPQITSYDFGTFGGGQYVDRVLYIGNVSATNAAYVTGTYLSSPSFMFKGGSYPGLGGNCPLPGNYINPMESCMIVLTLWMPFGSVSSTDLEIYYDHPGYLGTTSRLTLSAGYSSTSVASITDHNPEYYSGFGLPADDVVQKNFGNVGGYMFLSNAVRHRFFIKNTGGSPLMNMGLNMAGTNPSDFPIQSSSCPLGGSLNVNEVCWVEVAVAPQTWGAVSAFLRVTESGFQIATRTMSANGVSGSQIQVADHVDEAGNAILTGSAMNFGVTGASGGTQDVLFFVRNVGTTSASSISAFLSGNVQFKWGDHSPPTEVRLYPGGVPGNSTEHGVNYCWGTLPSDANTWCAVKVTFKPQSGGLHYDSINFTYSGGGTTVVRDIKGTGTTQPLLTFSGMGGGGDGLFTDFGIAGMNSPVAKYLKVTNVGGASTQLTSWGGMYSSDFRFAYVGSPVWGNVFPGAGSPQNGVNPCGIGNTLAIGESCYLKIEMYAGGTGPKTDAISLYYTGGPGPAVRALSGEITSLAVVQMSDCIGCGSESGSPLDLGTVGWNSTPQPTRSILVRNVGSMTANLNPISLPTGFEYPGGYPGTVTSVSMWDSGTSSNVMVSPCGPSLVMGTQCAIVVAARTDGVGSFSGDVRLDVSNAVTSHVKRSVRSEIIDAAIFSIRECPDCNSWGSGGSLPNFDFGQSGVPIVKRFYVVNTGSRNGNVFMNSVNGTGFQYHGGVFPGDLGPITKYFQGNPSAYFEACANGNAYAPGSGCYISVEFTAPAGTNFNGSLDVSFSGAQVGMLSKPLSGMGMIGSQPKVVLSSVAYPELSCYGNFCDDHDMHVMSGSAQMKNYQLINIGNTTQADIGHINPVDGNYKRGFPDFFATGMLYSFEVIDGFVPVPTNFHMVGSESVFECGSNQVLTPAERCSLSIRWGATAGWYGQHIGQFKTSTMTFGMPVGGYAN